MSSKAGWIFRGWSHSSFVTTCRTGYWTALIDRLSLDQPAERTVALRSGVLGEKFCKTPAVVYAVLPGLAPCLL